MSMKPSRPKYTLGSEAIAYMEVIWSDLMDRYPEMRPAFFRFDSLNRSKGYVEVRFAGAHYESGLRAHDILIRPDIMNLERWDLIQAIMHCAAHCLNYDRGIFDTRSRSYHGEDFKICAEELGLRTFWVDGFGYMTAIGDLRHDSNFKNRMKKLNSYRPYKLTDSEGVCI